MRDDMAERASEIDVRSDSKKRKGKYPRHQKAIAKKDEDGQQAAITGMGKPYRVAGDWWYDGGGHTDYAILRRFLVSNLGRNWDEVYSEICESADKRTQDGFRLHEALGYIVEQNCTINEDGQVCDDRGHVLSGHWRGEIYVHPVTKTLEQIKVKRRYKKEVPQRVFELDGNYYHEHEGVWYQVEMKELGKINRWYWETIQTEAFDAHKDPGPPPGARYWYFSQTEALVRKYGYSPDLKIWYCVGKKSAGKRVIRKLKKKYGELV